MSAELQCYFKPVYVQYFGGIQETKYLYCRRPRQHTLRHSQTTGRCRCLALNSCSIFLYPKGETDGWTGEDAMPIHMEGEYDGRNYSLGSLLPVLLSPGVWSGTIY